MGNKDGLNLNTKVARDAKALAAKMGVERLNVGYRTGRGKHPVMTGEFKGKRFAVHVSGTPSCWRNDRHLKGVISREIRRIEMELLIERMQESLHARKERK